jgi:hypothetical protein
VVLIALLEPDIDLGRSEKGTGGRVQFRRRDVEQCNIVGRIAQCTPILDAVIAPTFEKLRNNLRGSIVRDIIAPIDGFSEA